MKRSVPLFLILLTFGARPGSPQKAAFTDQQLQGRNIVAQSCAVCHLPSGPEAKTYGPSLNKSTLPDDDDAVRQTIMEGNSRMPGFKYSLQPSQIDAIIAYLRTVPPRPKPAASTQRKSNVDD
jgi:mono/diheme cytochrome c family protein